VVPILSGDVEEQPRLLGGEGMHLLFGSFGWFDRCGDVAVKDLVSPGILEGLAQHGVD
jgi:hypothetical protein